MSESFSFLNIQELYHQKSELISHFTVLQNEYSNLVRDYGDDAHFTQVELQTLKTIEDNPGITITEMAEQGLRTKGAISQIVKKLENRGLLDRKRCPVDGKRLLLHVNDEGLRVSLLYKKYSTYEFKERLDVIMKTCTAEELDAFFKVLSVYTETMEKDLKEQIQ